MAENNNDLLEYINTQLAENGQALIDDARKRLPPGGIYNPPFALAFFQLETLIEIGKHVAEALIYLGGTAGGAAAAANLWKKVKSFLKSEDGELTSIEAVLRVIIQRDKDGEHGIIVPDIRIWLGGRFSDSTIRRSLKILENRKLVKRSPIRIWQGAFAWFYIGPGSHFLKFGEMMTPEKYKIVMNDTNDG